MEVHAHTHTPRQKWTHYFWEFLMLFLAVFCGFLAENLREHYVERKRAREYAKYLLQDLKADTAEINVSKKTKCAILNAVDSLNSIARYRDDKNRVRGGFYYYSQIATTVESVAWHTATMNQIIHSGSVRYFENDELIKKISDYIELNELSLRRANADRELRNQSVELRNKILDNHYYIQYAGLVIEARPNDSLMQTWLPLLNNDPNLLNEYLNSFQSRRVFQGDACSNTPPSSLKKANDLMALLQKEYHLK